VDALFQKLVEHARDVAMEPKLGPPATRLLQVVATGATERLEGAVADLCGIPAGGKQTAAAAAFFEYRRGLGKGTTARSASVSRAAGACATR